MTLKQAALALGAALQLGAAAAAPCCNVLELRQYTMYPGRREDLIALFDTHFVDGLEASGMRVAGQFRDLNDADRFVWIRGFADMEQRRQALQDFYFGPLWLQHREQANATLFDNDDVLLLKPIAPAGGMRLDGLRRPAPGETPPGRFVVATILYFAQAPDAFAARFEREYVPLFERAGAQVLGRFVTDDSRNTFERLPVREGVHVLVWLSAFADRAAYDAWVAALAREPRWRDALFADMRKGLTRPPETLMLQPTARSLLR
jgi:hypothetical protein